MKKLTGAFRKQPDDKNVAKAKEEHPADQNRLDSHGNLKDTQNLLGPHGPLTDSDVAAEAIAKEDEYVNGHENKNIEENNENKSNNE